MTATDESQRLTEALALIDEGLGSLQHRELVSSNEMSNLLLDVRLLLMQAEHEERQLN